MKYQVWVRNEFEAVVKVEARDTSEAEALAVNPEVLRLAGWFLVDDCPRVVQVSEDKLD